MGFDVPAPARSPETATPTVPEPDKSQAEDVHGSERSDLALEFLWWVWISYVVYFYLSWGLKVLLTQN